MTTQPIVQRIPALVHGISRQPPQIRYPGQVDEARNVVFSVVDGATRRPGTRAWVRVGDAERATRYRMHRIERDDIEEYLIVHGPNVFEVVDVVNRRVATISKTLAAENYLAAGSPVADDLTFTTIADTTIIANRKVAPRTLNDGADIDPSTMPIALRRTSVNPLTFELDVISWKGRPFSEQVLTITGSPTSGTFRLSYLGDLTRPIPWNATTKFIQESLEGNGVISPASQAVEGLRGLPFGKVIVTGGPLPEKRVFIRISSDVEIDTLLGVVSNSTGASIEVKRGTDDTNPAPEFIRKGFPIVDVGYFQGRLMVAADEFVVASAVDDLFNFYLEDGDQIVDSDPVELQLAASDVAKVEFLVPYRDALLVLTEAGQQFEIRSVDGVFGPASAIVRPSTRIETQPARPVALGNRLYFASADRGGSTVFEYTFSEAVQSNAEVDVTRHVRGLIPPSVVAIEANTSNDTLFVLTELPEVERSNTIVSAQTGVWSDPTTWVGAVSPQPFDTAVIANGHTVTFSGYAAKGAPADPDSGARIFVFSRWEDGAERRQAAWSEWTFDADQITDISVIDEDLFALRFVIRSDGTSFLQLDRVDTGDLESPDAGFPFRVCLDHAVPFEAADATLDGADTTWPLTGLDFVDSLDDSTLNRVVLADGTAYEGTVDPDRSLFRVADEDLTGQAAIVGRAFTSTIELTPIFFRSNDTPIVDGWAGLRRVLIQHRTAGPYRLIASSTQPTPDAVVPFDPGVSQVGGDGEIVGTVLGNARDLTLSIVADSERPVTIASIEYHGEFRNWRIPNGT